MQIQRMALPRSAASKVHRMNVRQEEYMRYLIQNKKEFAITVAAFIMAVINLFKAVKSHEMTEDLLIAVFVTGTTVLAWYYNMPTSEENCKATGLVRLEKAERAYGESGGETFFDEPEEEDTEEGPEEDGEQPEDSEDLTEEGDEE